MEYRFETEYRLQVSARPIVRKESRWWSHNTAMQLHKASTVQQHTVTHQQAVSVLIATNYVCAISGARVRPATLQ